MILLHMPCALGGKINHDRGYVPFRSVIGDQLRVDLGKGKRSTLKTGLVI